MSAQIYSVLDKSKDSYSLWETLWSKNMTPWHQRESSDQRIKIYVADIFSIKPEEVGKFDVIWARADYTIVKIAERETVVGIEVDKNNYISNHSIESSVSHFV
ncbi:hypothetical protein Avbf_17432 [Armadillidium vulgare]|nr:hypothetical protein Avbf_17432 [Armadillidium vulgare]